MSNDQRSPYAPTHDVFAVLPVKGRKNVWQKIGACWPHEDGDGFSLKLDFLPLNGADLVIRKYKPKADQADSNDAGSEGDAI